VIIKGMAVGPIQANCYVLGCEVTRKSAVIDPGDEAERILAVLNQENLGLEYIINTHGHFDHVGANRAIKEATGAKLLAHQLDSPMLENLSQAAAAWGMRVENSPKPDIYVADGDTILLGQIELKFLHTPGHSPGGISILADGVVFVGDLLFAGSIGRTDFPGGDYNTLIRSVKTKIFPLADNVQVLSGHGPATTVGREKRANPFFR